GAAVAVVGGRLARPSRPVQSRQLPFPLPLMGRPDVQPMTVVLEILLRSLYVIVPLCRKPPVTGLRVERLSRAFIVARSYTSIGCRLASRSMSRLMLPRCLPGKRTHFLPSGTGPGIWAACTYTFLPTRITR